MKVSVIIPTYNVEKYLGVCLESFLIQTFTDFEVIVVDDCSTDNSVAVAENFLERFGGRLKIFTLPTNTGSGSVPRNVGLENSSGEYIFFADADDFVLDNALEILVGTAQTYRADVVYVEALLRCDTAELVPTDLIVEPWDKNLTVEEPTLESDDFAVRVKKFIDFQVRWTSSLKLLRRDFLVDNAIKFPPVRTCEDGIWTFELLCLAKRWVRIPTPMYVYRRNETSATHSVRSPQDELKFWFSPLITGVDYLHEFIERFEFFRRQPEAGVRVINSWANECFQHMSRPIKELAPREVYEILFREFVASESKHPALIAYLLFIANTYRNELTK